MAVIADERSRELARRLAKAASEYHSIAGPNARDRLRALCTTMLAALR